MIVKKMISNAIFGAIVGVLIGLVYRKYSLAVFGWAILMAFFFLYVRSFGIRHPGLNVITEMYNCGCYGANAEDSH